MSAYHRTAEAQRRANQARAMVVLPTECWRCGLVIEAGMAWQMGHTMDVALGGEHSPLRPEHRRCNARAGGRTGAKVTNARKARGQRPTW